MATKAQRTKEAILEASVQLIASQGTTVSTASIAKLAEVAQGSVFNHFETKATLFNAVYLALKEELNDAVFPQSENHRDVRHELRLAWDRWLDWGTEFEDRFRALFLLDVSDMVTDETRAEGEGLAEKGVNTFRRAAAEGVFAEEPIEFLGAASSALARTTVDMMLRHPTEAAHYRDVGFEALWRMLH